MRVPNHLLCLLVAIVGCAVLPAQEFFVLHNFSNTSQVDQPQTTLVEVSPGTFVGSYSFGLFGVTSVGAFRVLASFQGNAYGSPVPGALVPASNGYLYGVRETGLGPTEIYRTNPSGSLENILNSSLSSAGPLIEASDGDIWGTQTLESGSYSVFKMSLSGTLTTVFQGVGGPTGAPLLQASDGNFYGATASYSATDTGLIYRVTPGGAYTVLYTFPEGEGSWGGLMEGSNGLLYGTGAYTIAECPDAVGEVFSISLAGAFRSLHQFTTCYPNIELGPNAGLLEASDGNLYGSTSGEGISEFGTIFSLGLEGAGFKNIVQFDYSDGATPFTEGPALIQGSDGELYGTTQGGGSDGGGVVFKLDLGLAPPLPSVKLVQPDAGAPGATIRLTGKYLLGLSAVSFNGTPATFLPLNVNYAEATVPQGATSGPITVTTMNGSFTTKSTFTVQ